MDQSAINKIIMDASTEDPNKKLEKLEKEVAILKGSIKKLIVDIREQMNNAENPFLNIQQLQMPSQVPVIKDAIAPIALEAHGAVEKAVDEKEAGKLAPKEMVLQQPPEESPEDRRPEDGRRDLAINERKPRAFPQDERQDQPRHRPQTLSRRELEVISEYEEQKRMLDTLKSKTSIAGPASLAGPRPIDPYTINRIMDWTRMMLRKNGSERLKDLLDLYVSTGYISNETKVVIHRITKLMEAEPTRPPKRLDIKECVSDLYTLYVILNPGDKDLDSRMLTVLLNPDDR